MKKIEQLIQIAIDNKKNSYSPYSNFRVSCVCEMKSGKVYKGVNIENAAYSPSLCAERSAMSTAISEGETKFSYIVITGDSDFTYPCGVCRQFIREFADNDTQIVVAKDTSNYKIFSIEDLLPHSFTSKDLEI